MWDTYWQGNVENKNRIFLGLWLIFGLFYWAIAWYHKDIAYVENPDNPGFADHIVCADQVFDFTTAFFIRARRSNDNRLRQWKYN